MIEMFEAIIMFLEYLVTLLPMLEPIIAQILAIIMAIMGLPVFGI